MQIGDRVKIAGQVWTTNPSYGSDTILHESTFKEPRQALLLGKSKRFTGVRHYKDYDSGGYLQVLATHDVWMVMPIASGNQFRKPIAVLESQILKDE